MGSSEHQPKQPLPGVFAKAEMPELNLAPFIQPCLFSLVSAEIPQESQDRSTGLWNISQGGLAHQTSGPGPLGVRGVAQGLKKTQIPKNNP